MRVVTIHRPEAPEDFLVAVGELFNVLRRLPGFLQGELARSPDDPQVWLLTSRWLDVGSMRRGMGSFEAKIALAPVMATAADQVSVFEVMLQASPDAVVQGGSDRAPDTAPEL